MAYFTDKKDRKKGKEKVIWIETGIQRYILHLRNTYAKGHRWFKKYFLRQRINFLLQNPFDLIFGRTKDKLCTFLCKLFLQCGLAFFCVRNYKVAHPCANKINGLLLIFIVLHRGRKSLTPNGQFWKIGL